MITKLLKIFCRKVQKLLLIIRQELLEIHLQQETKVDIWYQENDGNPGIQFTPRGKDDKSKSYKDKKRKYDRYFRKNKKYFKKNKKYKDEKHKEL